MASGTITSWQIDGETMETVTDFYFRSPKSLQMVPVALKLRDFLLERKAMTNLDSILKSRHYFAYNDLYSESYDFSSSHVWMWELDIKRLTTKELMFWTVVLEKTLESLLDSKEIKPVNPKGNQSWIFIGRTDANVKLQYFGHLMRRADSLEKTLMLGKIEVRWRMGWQRMR